MIRLAYLGLVLLSAVLLSVPFVAWFAAMDWRDGLGWQWRSNWGVWRLSTRIVALSILTELPFRADERGLHIADKEA